MSITLVKHLTPALAGLVVLSPQVAAACEFYRDVETRTEIYDLPNAGNGLAVAILPNGSSVCIVEEKTDELGTNWQRVDFYTSANVKYNAGGWIKSDTAASAKTQTAALESTSGSTSDAQGDGKEAFFSQSWELDPESSRISFVSIKKGTVAEAHEFGRLRGSINPDGTAKVAIDLESVATGIDIRDVRMRFLMFEVENFPEATITAQIDRAAFEGLWDNMRVMTDLPVTLSIRGKESDFTIPVVVSRLGDQMVSVASATPTMVSVESFDMTEGLAKLSEAAGNIAITPVSPVTFELAFRASKGR